MATIEVETKAEFIARHGGGPVLHNGLIYLPSGATVTDGRWDERREAPQDPQARLQAQRLYWQLRVQNAEEKFATVKSNIAQQFSFARRYPNACPPPAANVKQVLEELKKQVQETRRGLKKIDDQIFTPKVKAEMEEARRSEEARKRKFERQARETLSVDI